MSAPFAMTEQAIAINRFGLGPRPGDRPPGDPQRWVLSQIARYEAQPALLADYDFDAAAVAGAVEGLKAKLGEIRREDRNRAKGEAPMARERKEQLRQDMRGEYFTDVALRTRLAVESDTPFMERMVHFWANHFAISQGKGALRTISGAYEFGVVRPHVAGTFRDLLVNAALHPAMLTFLDQSQSIGPNSPVAKAAQRRDTGRELGLNENLAREILELHTMGVGSGYTQADVTSFARALTGWTLPEKRFENRSVAQANGAVFVNALHEPGAVTILGKSYAQEGPEQALAVIDDIAAHPATARFIATKLARHFAGDDPPEAMVARLAKTFTDTGGNLPDLYRAIVASPEAWVEQPLKYRQPWEWYVASLRATSFDVVREDRHGKILMELGQPVWDPGSPEGYKDAAGAWTGASALMRRVQMAEIIAKHARLTDVRKLADDLFPGSLSANTEETLRWAESNEMGLALLLLSPEMLRR